MPRPAPRVAPEPAGARSFWIPHLQVGESVATIVGWAQDVRAMAEVRLERVEKTYARGKRVLHELDLTVRDEEFLSEF